MKVETSFLGNILNLPDASEWAVNIDDFYKNMIARVDNLTLEVDEDNVRILLPEDKYDALEKVLEKRTIDHVIDVEDGYVVLDLPVEYEELGDKLAYDVAEVQKIESIIESIYKVIRP